MRILVTNDDGVFAPGLRILANTLKALGEVIIVAPDRNRSGVSSALTLDRPLRLHTIEPNIISVQGTPTDCVHLASTGLLDPEPDIVVSGINCGSNLGDDVFYSGTVAGAIEGRFMGLPSVAVSCASRNPQHYETAALIVRNLIQRLVQEQLPSDTILNINVPDLPLNEIKGMSVVRLGTRHSAEPTIRTLDPRGHEVFWVGLPGLEADAGPGTDFYAISEGCVAITPLQLDMTNYKLFDSVAAWVTKLKIPLV